VSTFTVLHPSLSSLNCTASGSYFLSEQQLEDMKIADMQAFLTNALKGRSTQPTDTGVTHAFLLYQCAQIASPFCSAYYIHTSGSTGKPKCVVHCHSSLDWHSHVTLLGSGLTRVDDTCLQVADCSFDLHIRDIFCFISTGAHVVTIPSGLCMP
jgi:acyl-coenzyme A synthetase/AMP-(fatty) acid ligase